MDSAPSATPSRQLRGWRLGLASAFLVWHVAALLAAPAPGSFALGTVFPAFWPYLSGLHLYNEWSFFAPHPDQGRMLVAEVEDASGGLHAFPLTAELERRDPAFFRLTTLFTEIASGTEPYPEAAAAFLCRRHADLAPIRVTFLVRSQLRFTPHDHASGASPLDDAFLEDERLPSLPCP